jgi:hypothetical protein
MVRDIQGRLFVAELMVKVEKMSLPGRGFRVSEGDGSLRVGDRTVRASRLQSRHGAKAMWMTASTAILATSRGAAR